jgi:O-antigen/teichoic acid export membrane protein
MFKNVRTKLIASVLAFVNTILFTRIIGTELNGLFTLLSAQVGLVTTISNLGTDTTFNYLISSKKINIKSAMLYWVIFALMQLALIALLLFFYGGTTNDEIAKHKGLFLIYCGIALFNASLSGMLNGLQQFRYVNWVNLFMQITSIAIWVYFYFFQTHGQIQVVYLFIGLQAIPSILLFVLLLIKFLPGLQLALPTKALIQLIFTYSLLVLITNFVQQLAMQINLFQLKHYYTTDYLKDAGLLGNALKLIQLLWIIPMAISSISFSIIAHQGMQAFEQHKAKNRIVFQLLCVVSFCLYISSSIFIPLLFGSSFQDSVPLFKIILIGATLFLIPVIIAPFFSGNNLIKYNLYASGLCLLVATVLGIILIPEHKAIGAAIALSAGLAAAALLNMYHFAQFSKSSLLYFFVPQFISPKKIIALLRD